MAIESKDEIIKEIEEQEFADQHDPNFEATNSSPAKTAFIERTEYKELAYPFFDNFPSPIDVWYEKGLYGKVDEEYSPVVTADEWKIGEGVGQLTTQVLKKVPTEGPQVFAMNFVVDAFIDLRNYMYRAASLNRVVTEGSNFMPLEPQRGWASFSNDYGKYFEMLYEGFISTFLDQKDRRGKIENFTSFMKSFSEFVDELMPSFPLSASGYVLSSQYSIDKSGLVIDLATANHGSDSAKFDEYIEDPNFLFFVGAASLFGFKIDKNAPWRLVADIKGTIMQEYMSHYPRKPINPGEPFKPETPCSASHEFFSEYVGHKIQFTSAYMNDPNNNLSVTGKVKQFTCDVESPQNAHFTIQTYLPGSPDDLLDPTQAPLATADFDVVWTDKHRQVASLLVWNEEQRNNTDPPPLGPLPNERGVGGLLHRSGCSTIQNPNSSLFGRQVCEPDLTVTGLFPLDVRGGGQSSNYPGVTSQPDGGPKPFYWQPVVWLNSNLTKRDRDIHDIAGGVASFGTLGIEIKNSTGIDEYRWSLIKEPQLDRTSHLWQNQGGATVGHDLWEGPMADFVEYDPPPTGSGEVWDGQYTALPTLADGTRFTTSANHNARLNLMTEVPGAYVIKVEGYSISDGVPVKRMEKILTLALKVGYIPDRHAHPDFGNEYIFPLVVGLGSRGATGYHAGTRGCLYEYGAQGEWIPSSADYPLGFWVEPTVSGVQSQVAVPITLSEFFDLLVDRIMTGKRNYWQKFLPSNSLNSRFYPTSPVGATPGDSNFRGWGEHIAGLNKMVPVDFLDNPRPLGQTPRVEENWYFYFIRFLQHVSARYPGRLAAPDISSWTQNHGQNSQATPDNAPYQNALWKNYFFRPYPHYWPDPDGYGSTPTGITWIQKLRRLADFDWMTPGPSPMAGAPWLPGTLQLAQESFDLKVPTQLLVQSLSSGSPFFQQISSRNMPGGGDPRRFPATGWGGCSYIHPAPQDWIFRTDRNSGDRYHNNRPNPTSWELMESFGTCEAPAYDLAFPLEFGTASSKVEWLRWAEERWAGPIGVGGQQASPNARSWTIAEFIDIHSQSAGRRTHALPIMANAPWLWGSFDVNYFRHGEGMPIYFPEFEGGTEVRWTYTQGWRNIYWEEIRDALVEGAIENRDVGGWEAADCQIQSGRLYNCVDNFNDYGEDWVLSGGDMLGKIRAAYWIMSTDCASRGILLPENLAASNNTTSEATDLQTDTYQVYIDSSSALQGANLEFIFTQKNNTDFLFRSSKFYSWVVEYGPRYDRYVEHKLAKDLYEAQILIWNDITDPTIRAHGGVLTFDNLFRRQYKHTLNQDIPQLKQYIRDIYNSYITAQPLITIVKLKKDGVGTQKCFIKRNVITEMELEDLYPESWWYEFYYKLRIDESRKQITPTQMRDFKKSIINLILPPGATGEAKDKSKENILKFIFSKTKGVIEEKMT